MSVQKAWVVGNVRKLGNRFRLQIEATGKTAVQVVVGVLWTEGPVCGPFIPLKASDCRVILSILQSSDHLILLRLNPLQDLQLLFQVPDFAIFELHGKSGVRFGVSLVLGRGTGVEKWL